MENENVQTNAPAETKFCSECGGKIAKRAVICPLCGCRVEAEPAPAAAAAPQQIIINNQNNNVQAGPTGNKKSKWVALILWWFLGFLGGHKFYEGKIGMGILYMFTGGFFGIGLFFDFFSLLFKPNPYYV